MSLILGHTPQLNLNLIDYDRDGWHTPEYENLYILDAAVSQFTQFTGVKGVWRNATDYLTGDSYIDTADSSIWRANVDHTSPSTGSFAAARFDSPGQWTQVTHPGSGTGGDDTTNTTPEDFGAVGDGVADDSSAVENAILDALATGQTFVANGRYMISRLISINMGAADPLVMTGNGTFIFTGTNSGIRIDVPFVSVKTVNAIDNNSSFTWNTGFPTLISTPCARIDLGVGHGVQERRVVKIISNDNIVQTSLIRYQGESHICGAVSGQYIYLTGKLRNTYTTSPRAIVYSTQRIRVDGLTFYSDWDDNVAINAQRNYLYIAGAVAPMLTNLRFTNTTLGGLVLDACVHPFTMNIQYYNGRNAISSASGTTGYGTIDRNCEYGVFVNTHGYNMRHTYTNFGVSIDPANPLRYGAPFGSLIIGGSDIGSSGAGFDCHSESEQITFVDLHTSHSYYGEDSSGCGIQIRGGRHFVHGCKHLGSGVGLKIGKESPNEYGDHQISDYQYYGDNKAIRLLPQPTAGGSAVKVTIDNAYLVSTFSPMVDVQTMDLTMRSVRIRSKNTTAANPVMFALDATNASLKILGKNNVFDWRGAATGGRIATYNSTGHNIDIEGDVISTGTTWHSGAHGVAADTATIKLKLNVDAAPTVSSQGLSNIGSSTARSYITINDSANGDSGMETVSLSTGNNTITIGVQFAPVILKLCSVTAASTVINNITVGNRYGQILIIANSNASTQPLVVQSNHANRIDIPADITINANSAFAFIWEGNQWKGFSTAISTTTVPGVTDHGALTGLTPDDDHPQYHNDARALTFINGLNIAELADVPARGTALQVLRVNSGASALEYANQFSAKLATFESYLDLYWFYTVNAGQPEQRMKDGAALVKWALTNSHMVIGGDLSARVGTERLTVIGDIQLVDGGLKGATTVGDYLNFGLLTTVRFWEDTGGVVRAKAGSDPASATDGRPIGGLGILSGSATYNPPSLADGAGTTTTVPVTNAALGDFVMVSHNVSMAGLIVTGQVTSAGTVTVSIFNKTGGVLDIASDTLRVAVIPKSFAGF